MGAQPALPFREDIFFDLLLDTFDHIEDVLTEADNDNPCGHLALSVQFRQAPADFRPELDVIEAIEADVRAAKGLELGPEHLPLPEVKPGLARAIA